MDFPRNGSDIGDGTLIRGGVSKQTPTFNVVHLLQYVVR